MAPGCFWLVRLKMPLLMWCFGNLILRTNFDVCNLFWLELQSLRPPTEVPNALHWKQPKNSRKGCRVGPGKTAEKQCFSGVSAVFKAVLQLFCRDPLGTLLGCFPLFSMSGIWHLCRWPEILQAWSVRMRRYGNQSRAMCLKNNLSMHLSRGCLICGKSSVPWLWKEKASLSSPFEAILRT